MSESFPDLLGFSWTKVSLPSLEVLERFGDTGWDCAQVPTLAKAPALLYLDSLAYKREP